MATFGRGPDAVKRRKTAATTGRARVGGWVTAVLVTFALLATLLGGGRIGQATASTDGSAWLWSRAAGEVGRINPDDGTVEQRREVPGAGGHQIRVTQNDRYLLIHDLDTGRVSTLDLASLGFSGRLDVGTRGDPHLVMGPTAAAVVERATGAVRALDPATLHPVGPVLRLPGPLVGGEFDGAGMLWVAVPEQGTVAAVKVTAQGAAVARTVEVTEPGRGLAMTVLDQGVLVVDRGGRDLVVVTGDTTRRVTAPVPLDTAMVPERTHGDLAAITVPAAGVVITLGDVREGGPVRSFPLRDPVQEPAVPFAGKVYVPVRETGQVRVYDQDGRQTDVVSMPSGRGDLELQVREGNLFINAPGSPDARVVGPDGRARTVGKYPDGTGPGGDRPVAPGEGSSPPPVPAPPSDQLFPDPTDPGEQPPPERDPLDPDVPDEPELPGITLPGTPTPTGGTSPDPSSPPASTGGDSPAAPPSTTNRPAPRPSTSKPKPKPKPTRNPYTAEQVCNVGSGGGYKVQRSEPFRGGRIYQLYSASTLKNCAVTMKTSHVGEGTNVWVTLEKKTGGKVPTDRGTFEYYAGPVYVKAPGVCVRYSGGASGESASGGWANCG